jgi:hypothetical protein
LRDARFQHADFFDQQLHGAADQCRYSRMRIGQNPADLFQAAAAPSRNGNSKLPAKPTQGIDARNACSHPERTGAMQPLQRLRLDRLDLARSNVSAAGSLEQPAGVGGFGLVGPDVGADIGSRQDLDVDTQTVEPARPVMRGAAAFHDDEADVVVERIWSGDGHGSRLHGGLLSLLAYPRPHVDQFAYRGAKRRGESMRAFKRTPLRGFAQGLKLEKRTVYHARYVFTGW